MDNAIFFSAFKAAGLLKPCAYKPGTPAEKAFDGQWQQPDALLLGDDAQSTDYLLEFQTADLPRLRVDDRITVDGRAFAVRAPQRAAGDGYFSTVALKPA